MADTPNPGGGAGRPLHSRCPVLFPILQQPCQILLSKALRIGWDKKTETRDIEGFTAPPIERLKKL